MHFGKVEGVWDVPMLAEIFANSHSAGFYLFLLIWSYTVLLICSLQYYWYLATFPSKPSMLSWFYKTIAGMPLFCIIYAALSILLLRPGVMFRPILDIIDSGMLLLLFELFEEMVVNSETLILYLSEKDPRNWYCGCLPACLCKSTFTQSHHKNFHLFVTQFTIVSPVLSLAHVSLTITGEDGTHGGHNIGIVHFFSVYLAVYGVLSLEHSIRPIFAHTQISLINKFWCLKTQLFLIVLQPVLFELIDFPRIGVLEPPCVRLLCFLVALTVESPLILLWGFSAFRADELLEIERIQSELRMEVDHNDYGSTFVHKDKDFGKQFQPEDSLSTLLYRPDSPVCPFHMLGFIAHVYTGKVISDDA